MKNPIVNFIRNLIVPCTQILVYSLCTFRKFGGKSMERFGLLYSNPQTFRLLTQVQLYYCPRDCITFCRCDLIKLRMYR